MEQGVFQSKDAPEDGIDLALKQGLTLKKEGSGPIEKTL